MVSHFFYALTLSATIVASSSAIAADTKQDFITFATVHCAAWTGGDDADMAFVLGKAAAKFSKRQQEQFNNKFADKLIADYALDPEKDCVLSVVNKSAASQALPMFEGAEQVVVAGYLREKGKEVPVSVAYRLERERMDDGWRVANMTLNGQPLSDRYREEFEAMAEAGGPKAILGSL